MRGTNQRDLIVFFFFFFLLFSWVQRKGRISQDGVVDLEAKVFLGRRLCTRQPFEKLVSGLGGMQVGD